MPIALLMLGSPIAGPDDSDATISDSAEIIGIVPGTVIGVVLHELVHGVLFFAFGGRPRFGFKPWMRLGPVFYAAAPGSYFTKLEYAALGLATTVLLTVSWAVVLTLVAESELLASVVSWALLLNVMGSAGDILMMRKLIPYPRTTRFEDNGEGFVAYGPARGPDRNRRDSAARKAAFRAQLVPVAVRLRLGSGREPWGYNEVVLRQRRL